MADLIYPAGLQRLLQHHYDAAFDLEVNLRAAIISTAYTPNKAELDLTTLNANRWNGTAGAGDPIVGGFLAVVDGSDVKLRSNSISFGTVTVLGTAAFADPAYVVVYAEKLAAAADADRYPLILFEAGWTPVLSQGFNFVVQPDSIATITTL